MLHLASSSSRVITSVGIVAPLLLRSTAINAAKQQRRLNSGGGGVQYNQPSGNLFGEKPLPKGQKRVKEAWELPYYWGMGGGLALMTVGYIYKPDTSIESWAMPAARKSLEESGRVWKYVPSKFSDYYGKEV